MPNGVCDTCPHADLDHVEETGCITCACRVVPAAPAPAPEPEPTPEPESAEDDTTE